MLLTDDLIGRIAIDAKWAGAAARAGETSLP